MSACLPGRPATSRLPDSSLLGKPQWLTQHRKIKGTIACQESSGRAQAHEAERCGTRAIWLKLDCLNPNLQKVQIAILRKAPETGVTSCTGMRRWPVQLPGREAMPNEGI